MSKKTVLSSSNRTIDSALKPGIIFDNVHRFYVKTGLHV